MRTEKVTIDQLIYELKPVDTSLKESILRQGQTFPVRVKSVGNDLYQVVDGHKRVTVLKDMNKLIVVDIVNDFTTAGSNYWGEKNHH